jgi:uncharacterized protein YigE (DUF2233 family)
MYLKSTLGLLLIHCLELTLPGRSLYAQTPVTNDPRFVTYIADAQKQDLKLYWKDDKQVKFRSIQNLKTWLGKQKKRLVFAMNAGMYHSEGAPVELYIENQTILAPLDTSSGSGSFYLKPNGVFYITVAKIPVVCSTAEFKPTEPVQFATQSGPMLVINGQIHPAFKKGSPNLNIRNGVGILPDHRVLFVISKDPVNFYDFAEFFKSMGCENALYLDGLVSRAYMPEQNWIQTDGDFGVLIGISADQ